jgi:hypothetical protein
LCQLLLGHKDMALLQNKRLNSKLCTQWEQKKLQRSDLCQKET